MVNNNTWEEFCNLYYETAKELANRTLSKLRKSLGGLDRRVDESYVVDETVLSSLRKTYDNYSESRGESVVPLLSKIVHNQMVDILESETRRTERMADVEDVEKVFSEHLRAEALAIPHDDLIAKLMAAVRKLSASDQVIIDNFLSDQKTFIAKSSEILNISEKYVSVRKCRILAQLRTLMDTTPAQYFEWKQEHSTVFAGLSQDTSHYSDTDSDPDNVMLNYISYHHYRPLFFSTSLSTSLSNPINPALDAKDLATRLLRFAQGE